MMTIHALRWPLSVCAALAIASTALAAERQLAYRNSAGIQLSIADEGASADDPKARLLAFIGSLEATLGAAKPAGPPQTHTGPGGSFTQSTLSFAGDALYLHALLTTDKGGAICHLRAPIMSAKNKAALQDALHRCGSELRDQSGGDANVASSESREPSSSSSRRKSAPKSSRQTASHQTVLAGPASHPENWNQVEGVYFKSVTSFGVGGMMIVDFRPLVLFRDGRYYEIDDAPLEDIDLAADSRANPSDWGQWKRSGDRFVLTDEKGHANDYALQQGSFFKAFPAEAGGPLSRAYKRVSGGGNSALGGEMTIAVSSKMNFTANGQFTSGTDVGALGSGSQTGVGVTTSSKRRMTSPGRYTLERHTLVMQHPDGQQERRFFAYASKHTPAQVSPNMIFIGDRGYIEND